LNRFTPVGQPRYERRFIIENAIWQAYSRCNRPIFVKTIIR
jgi:hypothetical protein